MRLETLADVRALIERHLPDAHRTRSTWQVVAKDLRAAAAGGDIDELVVGLRLALMIERVECRPE